MMNRILLAFVLTAACDSNRPSDTALVTQLRGIAEVQANQQQALAALLNRSTSAPPAAPAVVTTAAPTVAPAAPSPPIPCQPGLTCTAQEIPSGQKVGAIVITDTRPPCPTGNCPPVAAIAPAETCTMGWCLFTTVASYIGAIGTYALEIGLVGLGVIALLGYIWYRMRRFRECRHDRRWHHRAARLRGWYEEALEAANQEGLDDATRTMWLRRVRRRHARMAGHHEAAGVAPAMPALPAPPPAVWPGTSVDDVDEPAADAD